MRFCLCLVMAIWLAVPVLAQQNPEPPLKASWTVAPGFFTPTAGGPPSGFFGELAQELGRRTGLDLDFRKVPDVESVIAEQARGDSHLLAGAARIPALEATNVFSDTVATSSVFLFVDRGSDLTLDSLDNVRLGVVARTAGAGLAGTLGTGNSVTVYQDFNAALGALLFAEIDALVAIYPGVMGALRARGLESRVERLEPPLSETRHVISLHRSRAGLMPRIQAALDEMQADGTLDRLQRQWNLTVPDPVPEVLSVGVVNFPPYQIVEEDGEVTGFGVEALRELARRTGLEIRFEPISNEEFATGPASDTYDMLAIAGISPDRRQRMDFTLPTDSAPFASFVRTGTAHPDSLSDLAGLRVGVVSTSVIRSHIPAQEGMEIVPYASATSMMQGLARGEVDVVLYLNATGRQLLEDLDLSDRIQRGAAPIFITTAGIALRFGLAEIRDQLNAVIPAFLSSPGYEALRREWFGKPVFWTPERIRMAEWALVALGLMILGAFLALSERGRRQAERLSRQTRIANSRLATIMGAARSAVLGLSRDGQVYVANPSARRLLGVGDTPTPFPWPEPVTFLDREDLAPMEASHDPVQRALAGQALKGEVALMRAPGSEGAHYMRVSSAPVRVEESDVHTVVILDDVSEQERNRQQLERSSRLDALGQLTGGVAHDFNNLLATIEYAVQLASPNADEKARGYLEIALSTVRRGTALTARLLAFARKQPGLARSEPLQKVFDELAELARPTIESNIEIEFRIEGDDLWVYCDIGQLENAIINLVLNSRDAILGSDTGNRVTITAKAGVHQGAKTPHMPGAGAVYVTEGLKAEDNDSLSINDGRIYRYVDISVSDNGPGMTEEVRKRAVDPFFTTRDTNSGTGLGLSMVYGFVQQSGGELRIYSETGEGTTVRLLLPRGTPEGGREAPVAQEDRDFGRGETILVAEDDAILVGMIRDVLVSVGYEVIIVASGKDALDWAEAGNRFDLLLTDVVMPGGIGGFELARRLRARIPGIPIVYMSGYTGISQSEMGEISAPLIQKPCPREELARVLREELDRAAEAPE